MIHVCFCCVCCPILSCLFDSPSSPLTTTPMCNSLSCPHGCQFLFGGFLFFDDNNIDDIDKDDDDDNDNVDDDDNNDDQPND